MFSKARVLPTCVATILLVCTPRAFEADAARWTFVGPLGVSTAPGAVSGRVSAIVVDPRDKNVAFAGGAQGGVWKTIDGGTTWFPLTDDQPTLAIGSLALDPSNPDIIYAGTGEETAGPPAPRPAIGGSFYGAGVLKSTDGGARWTLNAGPFGGPYGPSFYDGGARIGSLAVSPANSQVLLAAVDLDNASFGYVRADGTRSGIYRSSDGGVNWTLVLGGAQGTEVLFDPTNGSIAYSALGNPIGSALNGVYKSLDGGVTWTVMPGAGANVLPKANVGVIRIAIALTDSATLYVGIHDIATNDTALGIWKTTDGGANWKRLTGAPNYCAYACYYNNVISVSPVSPNIVVVGGVMPYRSLDGGSTWANIKLGGGAQVHDDQHSFGWSADGTRLYLANDGGVYSTDNPGDVSYTWRSLNATLGLAQYYSVSIFPANAAATVAGSQDNGIQITSTSGWKQPATPECGDGGRTAIDPVNPNNVYATCYGQSRSIMKSADGGSNFFSSASGIATERENYAALAIDPSNPSRLYYGTYRVWASSDGAASWTPISPDLSDPIQPPPGYGTNIVGITTISVAPGNSNVIYTACGNDATKPKVTVSNNALSGAASTWTDIGAGLPSRPPSQIAVDRGDPSIAYISFKGFSGFNGDTAGHVFQTKNGGSTWGDISGNLPNTEVNDLLIDPDGASTIYAATDIGVYWTSDGGGHWTPLGTGLPRMQVVALAFHRTSRTLRAATYGRGMWDIQRPAGAGTSPPALRADNPVQDAINNRIQVVPGSWVAVYGTNFASVPATGDDWSSQAVNGHFPGGLLPTQVANVQVLVNDTPAPVWYVFPGQVNFQMPSNVSGTATVKVVHNGTSSNPTTVTVVAVSPGVISYSADFRTYYPSAQFAGTTNIAGDPAIFGGAVKKAKPGDAIVIYATGLAATQCCMEIPSPLAFPTPVTISIGSTNVTPLAVTQIGPGYWALGFQVPAGLAPGNYPFKITTSSQDSQGGVVFVVGP